MSFNHEYMCMMLVSFVPITTLQHDDREHCLRTHTNAWKTQQLYL